MSNFSEKAKAGEPVFASMNIGKYTPDDFDDKSEEYQKGFIEAIITLMLKGDIVPTSELN